MRAEFLPFLAPDGPISPAPELIGFRSDANGVADGALVTGKRWYRVENGIVDLLPDPLASLPRRQAFAARYGLPLDFDHLEGVAQSAGDLAQKSGQIEFFKEDVASYDDEVSDRSFYVASDRICFGEWVGQLERGAVVCDIGAGTGRITLAIAARGMMVVSSDISEEMLLRSRAKAKARGLAGRVAYALADAEHLPFPSAVFDACVCYGGLHHVPHPDRVMLSAVRTLKPSGVWLSYDPHRSPVRFVFDFLMKLWPLYRELASEDPLLTSTQLRLWCEQAGLEGRIRLHFFMPPHVLRFLPPRAAEWLLRRTDRLFNACGLGNWAGVIVVSGAKRALTPAAVGAGADLR